MTLVTGLILAYAVGVLLTALGYARVSYEETSYVNKPFKLAIDSFFVALFWPLYIAFLLLAVV